VRRERVPHVRTGVRANASRPLEDTAARRDTQDADKPTGRRVGLRVFIYIGAVHPFAAFLFLLFALGSRR
jgi:hypothetical protein